MGYIIDGIKNKSMLGRLLGWNESEFSGSGAGANFGTGETYTRKSLNSFSSYESSRSDAEDNKDNTSTDLDGLKVLLDAYATSAIDAETKAIESQYNNNKNLIDHAFQKSQSSAREQMDFQANQADLAWQRSLASANSQMAFQKDMLRETMDYNERMSSTAYQRVMKDLKSAGLNPILAFSNGSASSPTASVPSGASASAQAMSGASASASALSSTKADYSSAKKADIADITGSLLSSAGKLISKLF